MHSKDKKTNRKKHKSSQYSENKKDKKHCKEEKNKEESIRPSAFRAVIDVDDNAEEYTARGLPMQIKYPTKIFDLNDEYDQATSTFTPKQDGVYLIISGVRFSPNIPTNYSVRMLIVVSVNEKDVIKDVVQRNDFFGQEVPFPNLTSISAILQLSAGDKVRIFSSTLIDGVYFNDPTSAHFEAARLPSPLTNAPSTNNINLSSNILSRGEP